MSDRSSSWSGFIISWAETVKSTCHNIPQYYSCWLVVYLEINWSKYHDIGNKLLPIKFEHVWPTSVSVQKALSYFHTNDAENIFVQERLPNYTNNNPKMSFSIFWFSYAII